MITALLLLPTLGGLLAFLLRRNSQRLALLLLVAVGHGGLTAAALLGAPPAPVLGGWLGLDGLGRLFLGITSLLFLVASVYAVGYLRREPPDARKDMVEAVLFVNAPQAVFVACLMLFLGAMTLVVTSRHMGLLWVAVEATTLASAPLIYFHRHHRSLEATWKYLLVCSVGIALALLGTFFLAVATQGPDGVTASLGLDALVAGAGRLHLLWLKAGFVFLLIGYGTKMGLAPLHSWLPDAHSEAPSVVSALLSGALLNCAFLGILRIQQVLAAAGQGGFGRDLLLVFGLVSMGIGAFFLFGQGEYKRLLAYSSVEHMGILALGVGLGGGAVAGAMLHTLNHSLAKAMLFLVAGNFMSLYRTRSVAGVTGVLRALPLSGTLWVTGLFAITGSPPFGPFVSELMVLRGAVDGGRWLVVGLYLGFLAVAFLGMARAFLGMAQGPAGAPAAALDLHRVVPAPPGAPAAGPAPSVTRRPGLFGEPASSVLPPLALGVLVLLLGLWLPSPVRQLVLDAARALGGGGF